MISDDEPRITTILSEKQVQAVVEKVRKAIGEDVYEDMVLSDVDPESLARFMPVADGCARAREERRKSVAQVATELKVRQYELKRIEAAEVGDIDPETLRLYVLHLGLRDWYQQWVDLNESFAARWALSEQQEQKVQGRLDKPSPSRRRSGPPRRGRRRPRSTDKDQ